METKRLNNYKIDFYTEEEWNKSFMININYISTFGAKMYEDNYYNKNKYADLVSDITEELCEMIVEKDDMLADEFWTVYKDYGNDEFPWLKDFQTAKESFKSLSKLPYCVITNSKYI